MSNFEIKPVPYMKGIRNGLYYKNLLIASADSEFYNKLLEKGKDYFDRQLLIKDCYLVIKTQIPMYKNNVSTWSLLTYINYKNLWEYPIVEVITLMKLELTK
jgi:hypothetical protein